MQVPYFFPLGVIAKYEITMNTLRKHSDIKLNDLLLIYTTMGAGRTGRKTTQSRAARTKEYLDPYNPAKMKINDHYAVSTREYLGIRARHVILDSEFCITSKFLVNEGFARENIYAPNINREECDALTHFGVHSPHMSIEQFVSGAGGGSTDSSGVNSANGSVNGSVSGTDSSVNGSGASSVNGSGTSSTNSSESTSTHNVSALSARNVPARNTILSSIRPNALWYDSMTNIGGNETHDHYTGVVVDNFLKCNMTAGRKCTVAVTLATRTNQRRSIHGNCVSTSLDQIERLIALRGFVIAWKWDSVYKQNMLYAIWNLVYEPRHASPRQLLMWKGRSGRYIGFPTGYVL
jgi:hypothetical protein